MCGIWLLCGIDSQKSVFCNDAFSKIAHRGPDAWRLEMNSRMPNVFLGFHRLSIVDGLYGMQPMQLHKYHQITLLCNGEIYNCQRIQKQFGFQYETKCDVECIIHLYADFGIEEAVKNLDGVFSFVLIDAGKKEIHIARDPYGVRPSFILKNSDGVLGVCSEAKGLISIGAELNGSDWKITPFRPGCFESYAVKPNGLVELKCHSRYYEIGVTKPHFDVFVRWDDIVQEDVEGNIRRLLMAAVEKRLMSDRKIGCFLSGGLDSTLVAALLVKAAKEHNLPYKIESFSVGMEDSPDAMFARKVASPFIGTVHEDIILSEENIAALIDDVIYTLETPDITTIRASIGMYLLSKYVKEKTDLSVIFSGEGADELAQGYIYFRDAPGPKEAHEESIRLLKDIYLFDGLRADRTTAAHSLELRLPFLDQQFSSYYLSLPPELRQPFNGIEKYLLRKAFTGLIPDEILWRPKEAFSDGVTSVTKSLFQIIGEIVDKRIPDSNFTRLASAYSVCTPKTKESLYYRMQFEKIFPNHCEQFMGYFWMPKWTDVNDPSARFISHYTTDIKDEDLRQKFKGTRYIYN